MWFRLRSPELAEELERLMAGDRDIVRGSLDTVSDWRLTRATDVPGQSRRQADYVLIAEIVERPPNLTPDAGPDDFRQRLSAGANTPG
jgi:hypothetical protein